MHKAMHKLCYGLCMGMTRTTIEIDDDKLEAAARELGTSSRKDTVNAALDLAARRGERTRQLLEESIEDRLLRLGIGPDITDPEIMKQARR